VLWNTLGFESFVKAVMPKPCFIFLVLLMSSCSHPHVSSFKTTNFVLIDTCLPANQYLQEQLTIDYPIYYIGPVKDTINISQRYDRKHTPIPRWPEIFAASWTYSDKNLKIKVDTSFDTNCPIEYYNKDWRIDPDSTMNYHSSVFTIRNISDSIICMGQTFSVYYMHRELKNRQGEWIPIGKNICEEIFCGTGQPTIYIKPGEMILSKVKHYRGSFKTDCRLVFGRNGNVVYSNVFSEFVDEKIFTAKESMD
jgi:hypothetical protein